MMEVYAEDVEVLEKIKSLDGDAFCVRKRPAFETSHAGNRERSSQASLIGWVLPFITLISVTRLREIWGTGKRSSRSKFHSQSYALQSRSRYNP